LNICIQVCTTSADFVQNIFLKHPFCANSNDLYCLLLMGHDSRPYNNTGKHLTFNSSIVTSSDAARSLQQLSEHSIKGTIERFVGIC